MKLKDRIMDTLTLFVELLCIALVFIGVCGVIVNVCTIKKQRDLQTETKGCDRSKFDHEGWIAENGGGGVDPDSQILSNRLEKIENRLDAADSDINEIKATDYGCILELYKEQARAIDRNGHHIEDLLKRIEAIERRLQEKK